jgi:hypothetical protein
MPARVPPSAQVEADVLIACGRRCCLCYYLDGDKRVRRGQIAHVNKDRSDSRIENLAFLCFDHHDAFDSKTSQSKNLTSKEVVHYRDRLVAELAQSGPIEDAATIDAVRSEEAAQTAFSHPWRHPWRFPLWLIADQPVLFAYGAPAADGVCVVERIDLPDGRIVIACIQVPGNPGRSITNSAEELCAQVCERFEIDPRGVIWLENYEYSEPETWRRVRFEFDEAATPCNPSWTEMTADAWALLGLIPDKQMTVTLSGEYRTKLRKSFEWPPREFALGLY